MKYQTLAMSFGTPYILKYNFFHGIILCLCSITFLCSVGFSQTQISGVVNDYTAITAIDYSDNEVTVNSSSAFNIGDRVLLIQMQGANIDNSQSSSFGTITNYNNAGNYEIQTVCDIVGNDVVFAYNLENNYSISQSVQLVRIPTYTNAIISGADLTAANWNGSTGGVLAIEVLGTLDFGTQNIDVSGTGFRGANTSISGGNCSWILDNSYYTHMNSTNEKALKGEGISKYLGGKECGRGPQANGGGGGNNHNGGGGGGANYGAGGRGGERKKSSSFSCGSYYGLTSNSLLQGYVNGKLFMGGGGGAGHVNNIAHAGENGANGAGIAIIIANTINGNNKAIKAKGLDVPDAINDGGGGGGAGGTVVLKANNYTGNLNINVAGGKGAGVHNTGSSNCNGPGGGGGGGIALLTNSSVPSNLNVFSVGGLPGMIITESQSNCSVGNTNNAQQGQIGYYAANYALEEAIVVTPLCALSPLPIELIHFRARVVENSKVKLDWITASETINSHYNIERSVDGRYWENIGKLEGAGNSNAQLEYQFFDLQPLNGKSYYRLKQTDFNGDFSYSEIEEIKFIGIEVIHLFPNPSPGIINLTINSSENTDGVIQLYMLNGKNVFNRKIEISKGFRLYTLDFNYLRKGSYLFKLNILSGQFHYQSKLQLLE